jgi:cellulose 1,4-beta-cellobiosidase
MGVATNGGSLHLNLLHPERPLGSRGHVLDEESGKYVHFLPLDQELSFEVAVSPLPSATGGALYFFETDVDGGMSCFPMNEAGAKYGTDYYDALPARRPNCGKHA